MYQKEWDRIKTSFIEKLSENFKDMRYSGVLFKEIPQAKTTEQVGQNLFDVLYDDSDYNQNSTLSLMSQFHSKVQAEYCLKQIPDIFKELGYSVCDFPPLYYSVDNGPIQCSIKFVRNISAYEVTYGLNKDGNNGQSTDF